MQNGILLPYLKQDERLSTLLKSARKIYDESNLPHHNMTHIAQVLYRALNIIHQDKLEIHPEILIPACILHDIGYCVTKKKEGHEIAGYEISMKLLSESTFTHTESKAIIEAITQYLTPGVSLEADILFDADILDMAGYASMYSFFTALHEYRNHLLDDQKQYEFETFYLSRIAIAEKLQKMGMRTKAGKVLLRDGFSERKQFIEQALANLKDREDFIVQIDDLM